MSLMDVTVQGQCSRFIKTEICVQSIYSRLYGDLSVDGTETLLTNFKRLIGLLTFDLVPPFSRNFLRWAPPPESPVLCRSIQHRVTPKGYPYCPGENYILMTCNKSPAKFLDILVLHLLTLLRQVSRSGVGILCHLCKVEVGLTTSESLSSSNVSPTSGYLCCKIAQGISTLFTYFT